MKIAVAGAGGGIGKRLVGLLSEDHDITGIYRRVPGDGEAGAVAYDDKAGLGAAIAGSEMVIHAALNTALKGREFLDYNAAVTGHLLSLLDPDRHRLFVYFSSQVVYSGTKARAGSPYSEDDPLKHELPIDDYTRLKIEDEARVIDACSSRGIDYLIVRPTVVMGPGMMWATKAVDGLKWAPFGFSGRPMNLIHVDDLCRSLAMMIEGGVANEIFNFGDREFPSEAYFRQAGKLAHRPVLLVPGRLFPVVARQIPSTMWFMHQNAHIDCTKLQGVAPITTGREVADYFPPPTLRIDARSLEAIQQSAAAAGDFQARGQGYSFWFAGISPINQLSLRHYSGVIGLEGERVTVKAGTTLNDLLHYLDKHSLTLETVPEFGGVSVAACFFADVHGSSSDYVSVCDLIEQVGYVDGKGKEKLVSRDDADWTGLRSRRRNFVLTQVSFRCIPTRLLSNEIEWVEDSALEEMVKSGHKRNMSTTLHWFPRRGRLLVYNINPSDGAEQGDRTAFPPIRGLPYPLQRALIGARMRRRKRMVGKSHEILAPWRRVPFRELIGFGADRLNIRIKNMELCVEDINAPDLLATVRSEARSGHLGIGKDQGIGIRFSTNHQTGRSFVWIEVTSKDPGLIDGLVSIAKGICGEQFWFHRGKYHPDNMPETALFVPR